MDFDGRGLRCPLAFVKAKQSLIKYKTKVYLFDEDVSLYNFADYLTKLGYEFEIIRHASWAQINLGSGTN